jgi:NAD(P)-dependent dehydrogenase (short-subunit alcohol dehydrogenase family)
MEIKGKVAFVTGASRGLGKALVEELLQAGASKVYAGARSPASVEVPGAVPIRLDVTDRHSAEHAASECHDVQIVINNAGIAGRVSVFSEEFPQVARRLLDTNFLGIWNVSRPFAPIVAKNGGGAFVNVLSVLAWLSMEQTSAYSASKSAAWALTNGMRKELKPQGTFVSGVHVGYIDTDMTAQLTVPKTPASVVARCILDGLRNEKPEIVVDEISTEVKSGLSAAKAPYLTA